MADGLLSLLKGGGCHAQAFADDFAAVRVSSDLNAAVNLMQCILKKVTSWCFDTVLKVNPDKPDLFIFKRKHKLSPFTPPSLTGKSPEANDSAKYLGTILDRKPNWNKHLGEKIRKFHAARR